MRTWLALALLAPAVAAAQSSGEKLNPVTWSLSAPARVKAGEKFTAKLTAQIEEGWHLYSLKELEGGPIPTSIGVPAAQPFRLAGKIEAPVPITAHEEAFGMDVEFYTGEVEFGLPLETSADANPGPAKLVATARYQACDNKQCLPPRTVRLGQSVGIAPR